MKIVIGDIRESTGPMDTPFGYDLRRIEERVKRTDSDGLRARWESGCLLLRRRENKQLPKGVLDEVGEALGVGRTELKDRMRFAKRYPTESELVDAVDQFGSWHQIVKKGLTQKKAAKKAKPAAYKKLQALKKEIETGDGLDDEFFRMWDEVVAVVERLRKSKSNRKVA